MATANKKTNLLGLSQGNLEQFLVARSEKPFRARQIMPWIYQRDVDDFDAMTESQEGLILSFDHSMFIGVMTNVLFGVLAVHVSSARTALVSI